MTRASSSRRSRPRSRLRQPPPNAAAPSTTHSPAPEHGGTAAGMPPLAWGAGIAILGAVMRATRHPVLFGVLAGIVAAAIMIGFTRKPSVFTRRWTDAAALPTAGWVAAIAAAGSALPFPRCSPCHGCIHSAFWWRHYRARAGEGEGRQAVQEEVTSRPGNMGTPVRPSQVVRAADEPGDHPGWRQVADRDGRRGNPHRQHHERAQGGCRRSGRAQTEEYVEPHPTGIRTKGVFTRLKSGTLEKVPDWDGRGVEQGRGPAVIGRFADSRPAGCASGCPVTELMKGSQDRPGLDALLKGVARREFNMVAAWSVDRLADRCRI